MKVLTNVPRLDATETTIETFDGSVKSALRSQTALRRQGEHCSLDPERLAAIGLVLGSQIRVKRNKDEFALYTVSETRPEPIDTTVRMGPPARQRLRGDVEFAATISTQVPHPTLSDCQAREQSEFVERLHDDGCQRSFVALAPHGGSIERHTDDQALLVASRLGVDRASAWWCRGFKKGGGALERWHITSTDIHEASFPLLKTIAARGFAHAVAFHGFNEDEVLVGGAAPPTLKQEIAEALERVLAGSRIPVRIADSSENNGGGSRCNIVNRLTADGASGVQIEQSLDARTRFGEAIADAVAAVYREKLPLAT